MIKVLVETKDKKIVFIEIKGHANSAEYGKDLVCAAISGIVLGGLSNIENDSSFLYRIDEGFVSIKVINDITDHDDIVLETIVQSISYIAENNQKFVKMSKIERV